MFIETPKHRKTIDVYIRRTTYRLDPSVQHDIFEILLKARMKAYDFAGLVSKVHLRNDDGSFTVEALWECEEDAMRVLPTMNEAWDYFSDSLVAPLQVETSQLLKVA